MDYSTFLEVGKNQNQVPLDLLVRGRVRDGRREGKLGGDVRDGYLGAPAKLVSTVANDEIEPLEVGCSQYQ